MALTAYQLLERFYRRSVPEEARAAERRRTSEWLLRQFRGYALIGGTLSIGF